MLAISTAWNSRLHRSGKKIISQLAGFGFESVELSFSLTKNIVFQISKLKDIRVVSLHNFCPIPDGLTRNKALPDVYSLSSQKNQIRKKAIKFTKRTILTAKKLKARAVVLHLGRVEIPDHTRQLIAIKIEFGEKSDKFKQLKEKMVLDRKNNVARFFECAFLSLKELSDFAFNEGIRLGIENRFYYREIPNSKEVEIFLNSFSNRNTFYWHDTGHAYIQEKLGFDKESDYLDNYGRYLAGIHLHDVINLSDHKAPFSGEINFNKLNRFKSDKIIKVIEAHQPVTASQITYAKKRLEEIFN